MELKDSVPRLYLRIAGVDDDETRAIEDGEAKPPLMRSIAAVLLSGSFALTLACGPPTDEGTTVAPMAVVNRTEGACEVDGGDPGVPAGDGKDDPCTTTKGDGKGIDDTSAVCKPDGGSAMNAAGDDSCTSMTNGSKTSGTSMTNGSKTSGTSMTGDSKTSGTSMTDGDSKGDSGGPKSGPNSGSGSN